MFNLVKIKTANNKIPESMGMVEFVATSAKYRERCVVSAPAEFPPAQSHIITIFVKFLLILKKFLQLIFNGLILYLRISFITLSLTVERK